MVVLFQDTLGDLPDTTDAVDYALDIGSPTFPVTADPQARILEASPYDGASLPGKCVLSPEMEILDCYSSNSDTRACDDIREHAGVL